MKVNMRYIGSSMQQNYLESRTPVVEQPVNNTAALEVNNTVNSAGLTAFMPNNQSLFLKMANNLLNTTPLVLLTVPFMYFVPLLIPLVVLASATGLLDSNALNRFFGGDKE